MSTTDSSPVAPGSPPADRVRAPPLPPAPRGRARPARAVRACWSAWPCWCWLRSSPPSTSRVSIRPLYEDGGVFTLDGYVALFTDAGFGEVVLNTLLFAALTTLLTLVIAIPMAIVVVRTQLPGGR